MVQQHSCWHFCACFDHLSEYTSTCKYLHWKRFPKKWKKLGLLPKSGRSGGVSPAIKLFFKYYYHSKTFRIIPGLQKHVLNLVWVFILNSWGQECIFRLTCSHPELTKDHVLTSAYVNIFRTVTRNAINKSVWRKKDCFWLPLNKHAVNIWLSSLRIRAHLSWRTGKHLHVLHVLRTYPTCSYPGY